METYKISYYITVPAQDDIFPVGQDNPADLPTGMARIANSSDPNDFVNFNIIREGDYPLTIHLWEEAGEEFYVQAEGGPQFEFDTGTPDQRLTAAKNKVSVLFAQNP